MRPSVIHNNPMLHYFYRMVFSDETCTESWCNTLYLHENVDIPAAFLEHEILFDTFCSHPTEVHFSAWSKAAREPITDDWNCSRTFLKILDVKYDDLGIADSSMRIQPYNSVLFVNASGNDSEFLARDLVTMVFAFMECVNKRPSMVQMAEKLLAEAEAKEEEQEEEGGGEED